MNGKSDLSELLAEERAPIDWVLEINRLIGETDYECGKVPAGHSGGNEYSREMLRGFRPHAEVVAGWRRAAKD